MRLGRRPRDDAAKLEQTRASIAAEIETALTSVASLELELAAVPDLEAAAYLGEASAADVERHRADTTEALRAARDHLARLEGIRSALDKRVGAAVARFHRAEVDAAADAYREACRVQRRASTKFRDTRGPEELSELEQARTATMAARDALAAIVGDGDWPAFQAGEIDEPDWPEWRSRVAEALLAGPLQPAAQLARALETSRKQGSAQDGETLAWALRQAKDPIRRDAIREQLPERLRERFDARLAELIEADRGRAAALELAHDDAATGFDRLERVVA